MTAVLFFGISVYGQMVLTGVLEEKASRVVEVLLARIPPRALLAGKIAGIGLLGLAQIGVTAMAALITVAAVHSDSDPDGQAVDSSHRSACRPSLRSGTQGPGKFPIDDLWR